MTHEAMADVYQMLLCQSKRGDHE